MKVLVTNPPWPGPGYGARSDVRWPHKRSDKFIEYPIYLAYEVAVLEKAGIEVEFVDAVVEERAGLSIAVGRIFLPVTPSLKLPSYPGRMSKGLELGLTGNFIFGPVMS